MVKKARAEGNTIPEISDSIVYDADNLGNLDAGQINGSRDNTLVYSGGKIRGEVNFNHQEVRSNWERKPFSNGMGYRVEGFENFSTGPSKQYGNTTFQLPGNDADNSFTIHSSKSNIKAGAGDDTMTVAAGHDGRRQQPTQ